MSDFLSAMPTILRLISVLGWPKDVKPQEGSTSCLAE